MIKEKMYVYLGTNGTIVSPVHLEDIYYTNRYHLLADFGKKLTNGKKTCKTVTVPEDEVDSWTEIDSGQE